MKKVLIILFLVGIIFMSGCVTVTDEKLDDLQILACGTANNAKTCQTRLIEVGIVMPTECCRILKECCENE